MSLDTSSKYIGEVSEYCDQICIRYEDMKQMEVLVLYNSSGPILSPSANFWA